MEAAIHAATHSRRASVLAIILASYLMIVLDISIVITALPKIQEGLHFSAAELSWVQNAYTLAFGGLLLLGARAGDVAREDAGAASGLVNVAHQLGGSLGLGVLVVVFAAAGAGPMDGRGMLAHRIATSFTAGTAMLAMALAVVVALIARPRTLATAPA